MQKNQKLLIRKESKEEFNTLAQMFGLEEGFWVIAGPCAVELKESFEEVARELSSLGIKFLRGGLFKPRTSPYNFQGLGAQGLKMAREVASKYEMFLVSEVTDTRQVEIVAKYADLLQIGARNMQNFELLKEVGASGRPVMIKRGFCATLEEFELATEYLAVRGSRKIIMCERGIRTFESATRNTLDVAGVAILQKETRLPVIVDLSHCLGRKDIINPVAKAVKALGADGIMVEVHNSPESALCDGEQQLTIFEFKELMKAIEIGSASC